jgi:methyl-accepting chemotaxis protein
MKIIHRILLVGLIPLAAYVGVVGLGLSRQWEEHAIIREMDANIGLFTATSELVNRLQRERGRTALFLTGGCPAEDMQGFREQTDLALPRVAATLGKAVLSAETRQSVADVPARLKSIRERYNRADAALKDQEIADYTKFIGELLAAEGTLANGRTTKGLGKVLVSLMVLEVAKESAGQLRANGASLLTLEQPLTSEKFQRVLKLKSEVDANLGSPALALSQGAREQLRSLPQSATWLETEQILQTLLLKANEGKYGVPGTRYFDVITRKIDDLGKLIDGETSLLAQRLQTEMKVFNRSASFSLAGVVVLTLLAVWLTLASARSIVLRIRQVVSSLKDIAEGAGDLTARLPVDRQDELGELATHFNGFVARLQTMTQEIRDNAATLAASSAKMAGVAGQMASGVQQTSTRAAAVAAAARGASDSTSAVAASMVEASENLSSVASATEEMSATVGEIAASSEKARVISEQATTQARSISAMMQQLGEAAQEIGQVTEAITDISSQTNLLALNATIEAARAGAAGKGFAVVANEIKELARQTATATESIKAKIHGVQTSTGSAIADIGAVTTVIQEVGGIVGNIAAAIEEQAAVTKDVARNIAQASSGVRSANDRIAQTVSVSKSIAHDIGAVTAAVAGIREGGEQVAAGAGDLTKLAEQLKATVGLFKVESQAAPTTSAVRPSAKRAAAVAAKPSSSAPAKAVVATSATKAEEAVLIPWKENY